MFGADISSYYFVPERPDGVDFEATFGGWYDNSEYRGEPYAFDKMPANNVVLYAKWIPVTKTVKVELGEGVTLDGATEFEIEKGTAPASKLTGIPVRPGYDFVGWTAGLVAGSEIIDLNEPLFDDITLHPVWAESKTVSYKVVHKIGDEIVGKEELIGNVGSTVLANALPESEVGEGYIPNASSQTLVLERGVQNVITFTYSKIDDITYTVQYKYPDGTIVEGLTESGNKALAATQAVVASQKAADWASQNGYMFDGAMSQVATFSSDNSQNVVTFQLAYQPYTIRYNLDGGDWQGSAEGLKNSYTIKDTEFTIVQQPVKEGYTFAGWIVDGDTYVKGSEADKGLLPTNSLGTTITLAKGTVGNLEIKAWWQKKLVINAPSKERAYNANDIFADGDWDAATAEGLLDIDAYGIKAQHRLVSADVKPANGEGLVDVGEAATTIDRSSITIVDQNNNDVTWMYDLKNSEIKEGKAKIDPAEIAVVAADKSKAFGEDDPALTYTNGAAQNGEVPAFAGELTRQPGEAVGHYGIAQGTLALADSGAFKASNYEIKFTDGDFEIKPKDITPTPEDPDAIEHKLAIQGLENVVYNGADQLQHEKIVVKDGGKTLVEGKDYELKWSDDTKNVGTVRVTVVGINNYTGEDWAEYQIMHFPVTVTANGAGKTYGTADPALTATVSQKPSDGFDIAYNVTRAPGEDVDDYVITPSGDEIQGNYRVSYVTDIFEIVASGANVVTVSNLSDATGLIKTYDGVASSVSPTAAVAGSTFEYSLDGINWTAVNPSFTNAGTYSVWVRANAANYETTRAVRATVTINPRPAVIVANSATKTAGAADPIFTGTVTGLVRAGDLGAVSFGRSNAAEGVGFYPGVIGASYLANPNYSVTVVPGNFTVLAAPVPVTPAAVTPAPTPAAPAAPAAPVPAAPAPAAALAAATPAPAAEPIEDDATPQAAAPAERTPLAETEEIEDEGTPMGAFDEPHCWVHWVMLLGILITAAYGAIVVRRRLHLADDVDDYEKQVLGIEDEAPEAVPADGRQAL
ncbi:MBG domain-containing protein [Adlercreutzia equolifaciens]|uniref:MBG domain-containing protein n=1 Tax=Adlercreutzia equolifaciens TaxID=446660 RepID=UPI0026DAEDDA|nr:MBG domain-containing protein [Adlercreutzia equolifaciens]